MSASYDLVCFSHLRWDFVYQRPQHLLSRYGRDRRVFFVEEPVVGPEPAWLHVTDRDHNVQVLVPHLPEGQSAAAAIELQRHLLDDFLATRTVRRYVLWYYTPMSLPFTRHLKPLATVYDCMDELSLFKGASPRHIRYELELFEKTDLVFTGGQSLYEAKRRQHHSVYAFPSSVDVAHFGRARQPLPEPPDQSVIPHPQLGFFGVIDERIDLDLIEGIADRRPGWHQVLAGPVVKIDQALLPRRANIHYLGSKPYADLPAYLAGWDVALLPFARNDSTRFISPTKTPEYLAAGKPVVSTAIRDVVRPYGERGLVRIASTPDEFVEAISKALAECAADRLCQVDAFLKGQSWDGTWAEMSALIDGVISGNERQQLPVYATEHPSHAHGADSMAMPAAGGD